MDLELEVFDIFVSASYALSPLCLVAPAFSYRRRRWLHTADCPDNNHKKYSFLMHLPAIREKHAAIMLI